MPRSRHSMHFRKPANALSLDDTFSRIRSDRQAGTLVSGSTSPVPCSRCSQMIPPEEARFVAFGEEWHQGECPKREIS